jgi:hypothetical protein
MTYLRYTTLEENNKVLYIEDFEFSDGFECLLSNIYDLHEIYLQCTSLQHPTSDTAGIKL